MYMNIYIKMHGATIKINIIHVTSIKSVHFIIFQQPHNKQTTVYTHMTLFLHVTTHKGQGLWLIIDVCRYKAFIFANVGTNNVDQFTAGNVDNVIK
jgi:hypothetical protein